MIKLKGKGGFTLLELIVVLVIMGVLVGMGVTRYFGAVERNRGKQAIPIFGAIKTDLEAKHFADSTYVGASYSVDLANPTSGGDNYWTFGVVSAADTYTITATRTALKAGGLPADGGHEGEIITLNQAGTWDGNHPGQP